MASQFTGGDYGTPADIVSLNQYFYVYIIFTCFCIYIKMHSIVIKLFHIPLFVFVAMDIRIWCLSVFFRPYVFCVCVCVCVYIYIYIYIYASVRLNKLMIVMSSIFFLILIRIPIYFFRSNLLALLLIKLKSFLFSELTPFFVFFIISCLIYFDH